MVKTKAQKEVVLFRKMQKSPIFTIEALWKLKPQPIKDEFKEIVLNHIENGTTYEIGPEMFGLFVKGRHFTWQQYLILNGVERSLEGKGSKKISIKSGHGIGKSTTMSWLIIWFLLFYKDCRVPCTAPTGDQLHDVLWTEIRSWISKFPEVPWLKDVFDVQRDKIYVNDDKNSAFARARTARKESPEALAGLHAEFMLMIVDEASGVPDEIYNVARGAFTEEHVIVILISNPTRLDGYFYNTHNKYSDRWQNFSFSTLDSPLVTSKDYANDIAEEHGIKSDEYRIRVLGKFPKGESVDKKGYAPLLQPSEIKKEEAEERFIGKVRMGIDPSGEGSDETVWVVRDKFRAKVVAREKVSNTKSIAQKTLTLMIKYNVSPGSVWIDNFGVGAEITKEIALAGEDTNGINVGVPADNKDLYMNKRAEAYMRIRKWAQSGGEFSQHKEWEQLTHVRFRRALSGRIQIMGKQEMKNDGYKSPNDADALMLTFIESDDMEEKKKRKRKNKQFKPDYKKISYNRKF